MRFPLALSSLHAINSHNLEPRVKHMNLLDQNPVFFVSDTLSAVFLRAAQQLLTDFNWSMFDRSVLAQAAFDRLNRQPNVSFSQAMNACQTIYSQWLYAACQDVSRREIGYREVHHYLLKLAYNRVPEDDVADVAQEALKLVYEKIETCQQPETFLKFIYFRLRHAINRVRPVRVRRLQSLQNDSDLDDTSHLIQSMTSPALRQPQEIALQSDEASSVRSCLQKIYQTQPRLQTQIKALVLKYFDELDDVSIAEKLTTTVSNVYVLRSRALRKLQECLQRNSSA